MFWILKSIEPLKFVKISFIVNILCIVSMASEPLTVGTFNVNQVPKKGFNWSHCPQVRETPTLDAISDKMNSARPYILGLQEVFSESFYRGLKSRAEAEGFSLVPNYFSEVKRTGLAFVFNAQVGQLKPISGSAAKNIAVFLRLQVIS